MSEQVSITGEDLKVQLTALKTEVEKSINSKIDLVSKGIEEGTIKRVSEESKQEIGKMLEKFNTIEKQIGELDVKVKENAAKGILHVTPDVFKEFKGIFDGVTKNTKSKLVGREFELNSNFLIKAVGTMTETASLTGEVIAPEYKAGIVEIMQPTWHVRDLFSSSSFNSNIWRFRQEIAGEGAVGMTAEGATKNQIDFNIQTVDNEPRKITGFVRISEELLYDLSDMMSFLPKRLQQEIRKTEDDQFLYGDGTGTNIEGITANASTFSASFADVNAQFIDLIIQAAAQNETSNYTSNFCLISPKDYARLCTVKDAYGRYIRETYWDAAMKTINIFGVYIFKSVAATVGEYIIGNASSDYVEIKDKLGLNIKFFDQDADNVTKNLITVRAEERTTLANYYPSAVISGVIQTDIEKIQDYT